MMRSQGNTPALYDLLFYTHDKLKGLCAGDVAVHIDITFT